MSKLRFRKQEAFIVFVSIVALIAAVGIYALGKVAGAEDGKVIARAALDETITAQRTTEDARDAAAHWIRRSNEDSRTITALAADLETAQREVALLEHALSEATSTVATLRAQAASVSRSGNVRATGTTWSRDQVAATLRAAAAEYELSASDTEWVVETGCRVAYRESTYRTGAQNASGAAGLFQFMPAWGSLENRLDPVWSCYRFVRVFRDGGEAKIRQHWSSTIGGV